MLWLVEGAQEGAANRLREFDGDRWRLVEWDEVTWRLERTDGEGLTLIRGRQCATEEGLEVLIVGTANAIPDGRPFFDLIEGWVDRPALVMLPWGFGKWTGRRGRLVAKALENFGERGLLLADTAARPEWTRPPRLLRRAAARGSLVPAGSDPFPFAACLRHVGGYGFVGPPVPVDARWPTMLHALERMEPAETDFFGRRMGSVEFAILQAGMQFRKQFARGS